MSTARRSHPRRRGLTLVELLISMALLAMMLGAAVMATKQGTRQYEHSMADSLLLGRAGRALHKISEALVSACDSRLDPPHPTAPFGCDSIDFQKSLGWSAGAVVWSAEQRLAFQLEPNELDNGLDDDGDGYVDEGQVVLIDDPDGLNETTRVIVRGVSRFAEGELDNGLDDNGNGLLDESGFSIEQQGDLLRVRLSLQVKGPDEIVFLRSFESSIRLRN